MSYNIDSSDTDDCSLDLQGSASDIDVSQVFILPSLTSFCEVRCFKILTISQNKPSDMSDHHHRHRPSIFVVYSNKHYVS